MLTDKQHTIGAQEQILKSITIIRKFLIRKKKTQLWMIFKGQRVFKHQLKEKGSLTPLTGSHLPPTGWDTTYGTHSLAHLSRKPKTLNDLAKIRTSILLCHCLYQCNTFNGFPALQCEKNPNKCSETTKLKHF